MQLSEDEMRIKSCFIIRFLMMFQQIKLLSYLCHKVLR
jgi:hypothetical protein